MIAKNSVHINTHTLCHQKAPFKLMCNASKHQTCLYVLLPVSCSSSLLPNSSQRFFYKGLLLLNICTTASHQLESPICPHHASLPCVPSVLLVRAMLKSCQPMFCDSCSMLSVAEPDHALTRTQTQHSQHRHISKTPRACRSQSQETNRIISSVVPRPEGSSLLRP